METKKEYSKESYLDEKQVDEFLAFAKELNISTQEMADIEGAGNRREAIATRIRKRLIRRGFANKIVEAKKEQLDKFKDLEF